MPTEQEWAQEYGVSRLIVREAIGRLRGLALLVSKPRVGLRVADPAPFHGLGFHLPRIMATPTGLRELGELRLVVELGSAWTLAHHITDQQVDTLRGIARRETPLDDYPATERLDRDFHIAMLSFSGNTLVNELARLILQCFIERDWALLDEARHR